MSRTTDTGINMGSYDDRPLTDVAVAALSIALLRRAIESGQDVRNLVTLEGNVLTISGKLATAALVQPFFAEFVAAGLDWQALTNTKIRFSTDGALLQLKADGSIQSIGAQFTGMLVDGPGAAESYTEFFIPPELHDALEVSGGIQAGGLGELHLPAMHEILYGDAAVNYSFTGSDGAEAALPLFGDNFLFLGEGDDRVYHRDGAFGTAMGGGGADTYDGLDAGEGLLIDLVNELVRPVEGDGGLRIEDFENAVGSDQADEILGSDGANLLDGSGGDDVIRAGDGDDEVLGSDGRDRLFGGAGGDVMFGGAGNDQLDGGTSGLDQQYGGTGNDKIQGRKGNDDQYGGRGNDIMEGNEGNDVQRGEQDSDKLYGGAGDDSQFGGAGRDRLDGGTGNDIQYGGTAGDTFVYRSKEVQGDDVIKDYESGDKIRFEAKELANGDFTFIYNSETGSTVITYPNGEGGLNSVTVENAELSLADVELVDL